MLFFQIMGEAFMWTVFDVAQSVIFLPRATITSFYCTGNYRNYAEIFNKIYFD